jgi:hypothetical protein
VKKAFLPAGELKLINLPDLFAFLVEIEQFLWMACCANAIVSQMLSLKMQLLTTKFE